MNKEFIRTAMLLGQGAQEKLAAAKVAVYGVGGVGGHCSEALARCGVGNIHITDPDTVSASNLNRQCAATYDFLNKPKVLSMENRIHAVSKAHVTSSQLFVLPDNIDDAVPKNIDFIVDAIDTVSAKLALVKYAKAHSIPIISCMGMGNRLDPTQVRIGDLFDVTGCPLARVMRRELRKASVTTLPVAYSLEEPLVPLELEVNDNPRKKVPGSTPFVPSAAGLAMASYVVRSILAKQI